VYAGGYDDALVMHLSMPAFSGRTPPQVLDNLVMAALRVQSRHPQRGHFLLVLRSDGEPAIEARKREFRERANALGVPVYDELERAATALGAVGRYERFVAARKSGTDPD
jgi:acyl-CoA synthetase (NDP forming)